MLSFFFDSCRLDARIVMILWKEPRLGLSLISGGPNLVPPEVLRFLAGCAHCSGVSAWRGPARHGAERRRAAPGAARPDTNSICVASKENRLIPLIPTNPY